MFKLKCNSHTVISVISCNSRGSLKKKNIRHVQFIMNMFYLLQQFHLVLFHSGVYLLNNLFTYSFVEILILTISVAGDIRRQRRNCGGKNKTTAWTGYVLSGQRSRTRLQSLNVTFLRDKL